MKLFIVQYSIWNCSFSGTLNQQTLSIGSTENDAIEAVKKKVEGDAMDFCAREVSAVMGHNIIVE